MTELLDKLDELIYDWINTKDISESNFRSLISETRKLRNSRLTDSQRFPIIKGIGKKVSEFIKFSSAPDQVSSLGEMFPDVFLSFNDVRAYKYLAIQEAYATVAKTNTDRTTQLLFYLKIVMIHKEITDLLDTLLDAGMKPVEATPLTENEKLKRRIEELEAEVKRLKSEGDLLRERVKQYEVMFSPPKV